MTTGGEMSDWKVAVFGFPFSLRLPRRLGRDLGPWDGSAPPNHALREEPQEWAKANLKGGYKVSGGTYQSKLVGKPITVSYRQINFEIEEDAVLFKLFWL